MDYIEGDPSSTISGSSDMILVLEPKSFKPFKSKDEYMYAMKEDLADWFTCLYKSCITVDNFFEVLETGVELCKHANEVCKFALERQAQLDKKSQFIRHIPNGEILYRKGVKAQTFQARDNVSNFISWCRDIGVPEVLRFETDDLVLRKNERSVVLCLLEVARVGAKLGMLAPTIVQLEEEIDAELAGEPPPPTKQIITCDLKSLDEMVRELVGKCTCPSQFPIIKVGEGKYKIGDSQTLIFVRILRNHVMVRVGGGWDTLENYLDKHDPCRCHFKGHRGSSNNQSAVVKRPTVRRASAPSGQILAEHINQRSPKKTALSSSGNKQGNYVLSTPPRCESPVSGRSSKKSTGQNSSAECSQHSSTENLYRSPGHSPAKHASNKMLPPASVGKAPTSPAKRAASPASTSSLPSSSLRSSASSSLSASSEKLNSSESKSSGGRLDMDQISTMTLDQFKNLLNNQLITTARERAPSIGSTGELSSRPTKQKGETVTNKFQNPSTKNVTQNINGQGRGPKQTLGGRSVEHSPDLIRKMRSPSPKQSGEPVVLEESGVGVKPREKRAGLSFLPRPSTQQSVQINGESKIPMKKTVVGGSSIPSSDNRAQRSLPTTPKQERKYNRTITPRQLIEGNNAGKQTSSSVKRGTLMQRATTPSPRLQTPNKIESRRSSTPGLRELQIYSATGTDNLTDDTQSSADEDGVGLKTPTPRRRNNSRSQSGLSSRSSSTQSLNLTVKGDIPIEEPRTTPHPAGYAERWRRNKRSSSAVRANASSSSPDMITISRNQTGGHSVTLGKASANEIRTGLATGLGSRTDIKREPSDAIRRARSIVRNTNSKIARSQSADRFSQRQRANSISSVEDNDDGASWSKAYPQQRLLSGLGSKMNSAARSNSLKYERSVRPRHVGGSVTPNSVDVSDFDLSSRPLEEIKAALNPVNGVIPQVSDPNELDAPPEDPEMYEQMEKLFEAYRQKELRDMVEATDRSKDLSTLSLDRQDDDDNDSRGNNTDVSSLDSNANIPASGQSSQTGSRRSSLQRTSDAESIEKIAVAHDERIKTQLRYNSGVSSRLPTSRIPGPQMCRIPAPRSKIPSSAGGIPKSTSGYQKNGVKMYPNTDYTDDNSASASDCHEFLASDQVSDDSRRTSYSDESSISISTSDISMNNVGQRLETPVPKVAKPLTTGRQRLISSRRNESEVRSDQSKLVRVVTDKVGQQRSNYDDKILYDDDEDETY